MTAFTRKLTGKKFPASVACTQARREAYSSCATAATTRSNWSLSGSTRDRLQSRDALARSAIGSVTENVVTKLYEPCDDDRDPAVTKVRDIFLKCKTHYEREPKMHAPAPAPQTESGGRNYVSSSRSSMALRLTLVAGRGLGRRGAVLDSISDTRVRFCLASALPGFSTKCHDKAPRPQEIGNARAAIVIGSIPGITAASDC